MVLSLADIYETSLKNVLNITPNFLLDEKTVKQTPSENTREKIPCTSPQTTRSPQQISRSPPQISRSPQRIPRSPPAFQLHPTSRAPPVPHPIPVSRPSPTSRLEMISQSVEERGRRLAPPENYRMERRPSPPRTLGRNGGSSAFRVPEKRRLSGENHFVKQQDFRLFQERISPVGIPPHFPPRFYPEFHPHFPERISPPIYLNGLGNGRLHGRPGFLPHFPDIPLSPNHDRFSVWLAQQKEMAAIFHNKIHSDLLNKEKYNFGQNLPKSEPPPPPSANQSQKNGLKYYGKEEIDRKKGIEGLMKLALKYDEKRNCKEEEKVEEIKLEIEKEEQEQVPVKEERKSPVRDILNNKENMADKGRDSPRFKPYSLRNRKSSASPPKDPFDVPLGIQTRNRAAIKRTGYKRDASTINGEEDQEQFLSQLGLAKIIRQGTQN